MIRAAIVRDIIDVSALTSEAAADTCGATAIFLGPVRATNDGKSVAGIDYSSYEEMAQREMERIFTEATTEFGIESAIAEHRIGTLAIGDVSIAVVVAHPHRHAAMDALRYIVDETKSRATIWKLEHYVDGTREWVNAGTSSAQ